MSSSYGLQRYQSARTNTASREDILIMLYEGAVRFLERSIAEHEMGNLAQHKNFLRRGRTIIEEFQNTLDFEKGGDIALQLFDLYTVMLDYLTQANITRDMSHVRNTLRLLNILLDGWREAVVVYKKGNLPGGDGERSGAAGKV